MTSKDDDSYKEYGYEYYPGRSSYRTTITTKRDVPSQTYKCISNVYNCIQNDLMVKTLIGALKSHGCDLDPVRHISCELCERNVNGGYDPKHNQIVICKNNSGSKGMCCGVLTHELIHMFDYCRAIVDFKNLDHLACTEIRAASIMHCRFLTSFYEGHSSIRKYENSHQDCVKKKAALSVMMARSVSFEIAAAAVGRVFKKCYHDLEPFGRIPRHSSDDPHKIFSESLTFGFII